MLQSHLSSSVLSNVSPEREAREQHVLAELPMTLKDLMLILYHKLLADALKRKVRFMVFR